MTEYYLLITKYDVFAKEYSVFVDQGGKDMAWGRNWIGPIAADSKEDALTKANEIRISNG